MQKLEISNFPYISGSLAQLVQLDLAAAESAVLTLLTHPAMARAMGCAAHQRALEHFASHKVMRRYEELFEHLSVLRRAAPAATELPQPPLRFDPVRCFAGYASHKKPLIAFLVMKMISLTIWLRRVNHLLISSVGLFLLKKP